MRGAVGQEIVDILQALGLHGYRLFLVSCVLSLLIVWVAWRLASYRPVPKKHS